MGAAITGISQGTISVDDNSIYRALSRFEQMGIVKSELQQSEIGPKRKYYSLTKAGVALLAGFIERNILVFQEPSVEERIQAVLNQNHA
jgi:DNA-binding PadR family transcriptional regulator